MLLGHQRDNGTPTPPSIMNDTHMSHAMKIAVSAVGGRTTRPVTAPFTIMRAITEAKLAQTEPAQDRIDELEAISRAETCLQAVTPY